MRHAYGTSNFLHDRTVNRLNYFDTRHPNLLRAKYADVGLNLFNTIRGFRIFNY